MKSITLTICCTDNTMLVQCVFSDYNKKEKKKKRDVWMNSWPYLTKCCQTALKNSIIINIKVIVVSSTNTVNIDIVRSQIDLLSLSLCIVNVNPYPFSDLSLKITKQQHILQL